MKGTLKLTIELGNAEMGTYEAIADALRTTADKIGDYRDEGAIMDLNGNTVGSYKIEAD